MYFYDSKEIPAKQIAPGARIHTAWGERIMLSIVELDPGAAVANHTHPNEQAGVVVEGEFTMTIGGQQRVLKKGNVYLIPSNVEHGVPAVGKKGALVADIFSPPREDYKRR